MAAAGEGDDEPSSALRAQLDAAGREMVRASEQSGGSAQPLEVNEAGWALTSEDSETGGQVMHAHRQEQQQQQQDQPQTQPEPQPQQPAPGSGTAGGAGGASAAIKRCAWCAAETPAGQKLKSCAACRKVSWEW